MLSTLYFVLYTFHGKANFFVYVILCTLYFIHILYLVLCTMYSVHLILKYCAGGDDGAALDSVLRYDVAKESSS